MPKEEILSPLKLLKQREKDKKELREYQVKTDLGDRFLYGKSKEKFPQKIASANLKQVQRIQLPPQRLISREQDMLGQLFGHGDKFFGSKKMLPFAGTPDEEGSETWRAFGI